MRPIGYARLLTNSYVGTLLHCYTYIWVVLLTTDNLSIFLNLQKNLASYQSSKKRYRFIGYPKGSYGPQSIRSFDTWQRSRSFIATLYELIRGEASTRWLNYIGARIKRGVLELYPHHYGLKRFHRAEIRRHFICKIYRVLKRYVRRDVK